jgi:chemotaxis protein MotB
MARKHKHEDHLNHEAWAIPYGDLVTLLLAFFVVMYAVSSVNEGKYRVLSDSLVAAFRGTPRTLTPVQVGDKQKGAGGSDIKMNVTQKMLQGQPRSMLTAIPLKKTQSEPLSKQAVDAAKELRMVADQVENAMEDLVKAELVLVRRSDFWIEVEIRTDILFPSGSAQLSASADQVIEKLARAIAPFPNPVRVEGHTDDRPINTVSFFSNWELSAARAASVVRMLAKNTISPRRLAVIGYGEHRPRSTNETVDGRNLNRRVVMVILSTDVEAVGSTQSADYAN